MRPKKILVVSTTSFYGGGEIFVASVLQNIKGELSYIVSSNQLYSNLITSSKCFFSDRSFRGRLKRTRETIKKEGIDIVILNGGSSIYFAPFIRDAKCVIYRHTTLQSYPNPFKRSLVGIFQNISFCFAKKIIHVSEYSSREQLLAKDRMAVVHNGVKIPPESSNRIVKRADCIFLFLGRTEQSKGLDIILSAFMCLQDKPYHLDIVGQGDMDSYIKSLNYKNITFHGFDKDVAKYYQKKPVLITLPSAEAFGLSIAEAMSYGCTVITCAIGGIPEIVQNEVNGLIIDRKVTSLIDAIEKCVQNPAMVKEMGNRAYKTVREKFNLAYTIQRINKIIAQL